MQKHIYFQCQKHFNTLLHISIRIVSILGTIVKEYIVGSRMNCIILIYVLCLNYKRRKISVSYIYALFSLYRIGRELLNLIKIFEKSLAEPYIEYA